MVYIATILWCDFFGALQDNVDLHVPAKTFMVRVCVSVKEIKEKKCFTVVVIEHCFFFCLQWVV